MKSLKAIWILTVFFYASVLFAGTLWSGNAVRGGEDDFNTYYDSAGRLLASSRALPPGTEIEVTNQLNDQSVKVLVVDDNTRPGIFLLLSPDASSALSLERGDMILVQVQESPASLGRSPFSLYQEDSESYLEEHGYTEDPLKSADPDNNPFVRGEEELNALLNQDEEIPVEPIDPIDEELVVIADPIDEEVIDEVPEEPVDDPVIEEEIPVEEEIVIEDGEPYDEVIQGGFTPDEVIALVEPALEEDSPVGEELFAEEETVSEEETEEPVEEEESVELAEEITPGPDRIIYFLTPAELRPPEVLVVEEEGEESTVALVPQEVTSEELNSLMEEPLQQGSRYIQVAVFSEEDMTNIYQKMAELEVYFPMVLLPVEQGEKTFYRLLVGPASRDEMGVLLRYHLPAQGYTDAMEYRQN